MIKPPQGLLLDDIKERRRGLPFLFYSPISLITILTLSSPLPQVDLFVLLMMSLPYAAPTNKRSNSNSVSFRTAVPVVWY